MARKQIDPKQIYRANAVEMIMPICVKTGWNHFDDFAFSFNDEKQAITITSKIIPEVELTREGFTYPCDKTILTEFVDSFLIEYIKATFKGSEPNEEEIKVLLENFRFMFGKE
jgi:hypothetical protein